MLATLPSLVSVLANTDLTVETLGPAEPMLARGNIEVAQPARLPVIWGVDSYSAGANWDNGVNNEAIMVMVQFGHEKLSGGVLLPPARRDDMFASTARVWLPNSGIGFGG